jgi:hypothetical protein
MLHLKVSKLLFLIIFCLSLVLNFRAKQVFAIHKCGTDGICQPIHETCSNCPQDCGVCPIPTSTPTPSSVSGEPDSSSVYTGPTRYPTVFLNPQTSDSTNRTTITFSGHASIEYGTIDNIQYTLDDGINWVNLNSKDGKFDEDFEEFTFTRTFVEGRHTIKVRAKSLSQIFTQTTNYAANTFTIITTPPKVTLDNLLPNPTKNQNPIITGDAMVSLGKIIKVEVSLDAGKTWKKANSSGRRFSYEAEKLEDGNYEVSARVFDSAGNVGISELKTLIIDTLSPTSGGINLSIGPQVLVPDSNGYFKLLQSVETTFAVSFRGGPTTVLVRARDKEFKLYQIPKSHVWVGKISFENEGQGTFEVMAEDGASNKYQKSVGGFIVGKSGKAMPNTKITVFYFDKTTSDLIVWDGQSYGQENPKKADRNGDWGFILPPGRYFVEADSPGRRLSQSKIFEIDTPSVIKADILVPNTKIPFFNFLLPPKSFDIKVDKTEELTTKQSVSLIAFVSFWSTASQEQILPLQEAGKQVGQEKIRVVFVQEKKSSVDAFMKRGSYIFTRVYDETGEYSANYDIANLPEIVFLDANLKPIEKINRVLTTEQILAKLK